MDRRSRVAFSRRRWRAAHRSDQVDYCRSLFKSPEPERTYGRIDRGTRRADGRGRRGQKWTAAATHGPAIGCRLRKARPTPTPTVSEGSLPRLQQYHGGAPRPRSRVAHTMRASHLPKVKSSSPASSSSLPLPHRIPSVSLACPSFSPTARCLLSPRVAPRFLTSPTTTGPCSKRARTPLLHCPGLERAQRAVAAVRCIDHFTVLRAWTSRRLDLFGRAWATRAIDVA